MSMNVGQGQANVTNFQVGGNVQASGFDTSNSAIGFDPRIRDTLNKSAQEIIDKSLNGNEQNGASRPVLPTPTADPLTQFQALMSVFSSFQTTGTQTSKTNNTSLENQTSSDSEVTADDERAAYGEDFNNLLTAYAKANNLSENDVAKLRFAFYNSDANASGQLSDGSDLTQVLQTLTKQAQESAKANGYDVSKLSPPIDNSAYNLNISDAYNSAFEKAVNADPSLNADQKAALIYQHYNPVPTVPGVNQKTLETFQKAALQNVAKEFGIPPGWTPELNSQIYNAGLTGGFKVNLQMNLDDYASSNNLSEAQLSALKNAIQNPNDPNIPADIKAMAKSVMDKTIQDTKTQNALPVNWQPSVGEISNVFSDIASDPVTTGFVQMREMLNSAAKQIQLLLPDGPFKSKTFDLLMIISKAIIEAQNTVYELQQSHSEMSKKEGTAKLGMQDQQIREQKEQNEEIAKQMKKQQEMALAMKILGPIMKILEVIMNIVTGGLFGAIFGVLDQKFNIVTKIIQGLVDGVCKFIDALIPSNGNPDLERFKSGLKAFMQLVVMVLVLAVGAPALMALGPMKFIEIGIRLFTESDIIKQFCLMCGIPKDKIQWVVMAISIAISIAVAVVLCINPANAVTAVTNLATKITETVMSIVQKVMTVMEKVMDFLKNIKILGKIVQFLEDVGTKVKDIVNKVVDKIKEILDKVVDKVSDVLNKILDKLKQNKIMEKVGDFLENIITKIKNDDQAFMQNILKWVNLGQSVVGAAQSTVSGVSNLSQMKVADTRGKHEAQIQELETMIKMLQKILDSLLHGLSGFGEQLSELKAVHDSLLTGLQDVLNKTTSIRIT